MGKNTAEVYEKTFKRFTLGLLCIIDLSFLLGVVMYRMPDWINTIFLLIAALNVVPIIMVYYVPMIYSMKVIRLYLLIIVVPLYLLSIACLLKGVVTPLFWFLAAPSYFYVAFSPQKALRYSVFCFCLFISVFIVTFALQYLVFDGEMVYSYSLSLYWAIVTEMNNLLFVFVIICYNLYYAYKLNELKVTQSEESLSLSKECKDPELLLLDKLDDNKYDAIYEQIIEYIENKQAYLRPDFKITQMAYELGINSVYLANAIKMKKGTNFNNLINYYRVEEVKRLIQNSSSKYTLKYIYLSAGFNSQSSFNRAFKSQMNITPSEYYKKFSETNDNA